MTSPYVYYLQSKAHPSDPMHSVAFVDYYDVLAFTRGRELEYRLFRYDPDDASCIPLSLDGISHQRG